MDYNERTCAISPIVFNFVTTKLFRSPSSPLYPVALNNHGTLPVAPFVSMLTDSFVHGFRSGPSANEQNLVTRAGYAPVLSIPMLKTTKQKGS